MVAGWASVSASGRATATAPMGITVAIGGTGITAATAPTGITAAIGDTDITAATATTDTGGAVLIVDGAEALPPALPGNCAVLIPLRD